MCGQPSGGTAGGVVKGARRKANVPAVEIPRDVLERVAINDCRHSVLLFAAC
jgi:hypothetical protein